MKHKDFFLCSTKPKEAAKGETPVMPSLASAKAALAVNERLV